MKKRVLSMLLCACMLASALSVTALAAGSGAVPVLPEEPTLHLDGEKLVPTAEGTTHTFENGGVATLTTVGKNEAGGTDYALTLENVRATKSVREHMGNQIYAAGLHFVNFTGNGEAMSMNTRDTLSITLKGDSFIVVQGQADEAVSTALVSSCPTSISGDGSLFLVAAPAEGAETACFGINVIGGLQVGALLNCMTVNGTALALSSELSFTDGATLRWPTKLALSDLKDVQAGVGSRTLMDGEAAADMMVVATPSTPVTRGVAVFNLWLMKGSPAPEGEYPFTDEPINGFLRDAIHWAGATGLAKGYGNGRFGEMDNITNEQFAVLFYRLIGSPAVEGGFPADYPYAGSVSAWARDAMLRAVSQGWVRDPKAIVTHAEMDRLVELLSRRG